MLTLLHRFRKRTDGATAIEAAFIIPVFFAMVFSTFEVGTVFYRTAIVELAATDMSRTVMTGQANRAEVDPDPDDDIRCFDACRRFFDLTCEKLSMFGNCDEKLSVEVMSFDTIQDVLADNTLMTCPNDTGYQPAKMFYEPGDKNKYTRVRVCYLLDVMSPGLGLSLQQNDDGTKSAVAVAIRRNEPYLGNGEINPNTPADGG